MHITQFTERKITKIMRKRIGNDFLFYWIIKENDIVINPNEVINFKIIIRHRRTGSEIVAEFDVVNSSPNIKCENLLYLGIYDLIATWKTVDATFTDEYRDCTADIQAFEIVSSSSSECETDLTVTSEIAIGYNGIDAYEVWVKNGNEGKTYEDYIAFLQKPATLAAAAADLAKEAANNAATLANEKAALVDSAATLANTKAGLADAAAILATDKAGLADSKATLANEKAALAQSAADNANAKAAEVTAAVLSAGQLGSIKPTDAAPTPARNGNYTFSIGGNKPAWLTAEAGVTEVKAGDGVAVVYAAPSTYTYTHVNVNLNINKEGLYPFSSNATFKASAFPLETATSFLVDIYLDGTRDASRSYSPTIIRRNYIGEWTIQIFSEVIATSGSPAQFTFVAGFSTTTNPENGDAITTHALSEFNNSGLTGKIAVRWGAIPTGSNITNNWASPSFGCQLSNDIFNKDRSYYLKPNTLKSISDISIASNNKVNTLDFGKGSIDVYKHPSGSSEFVGDSIYVQNALGVWCKPTSLTFNKIQIKAAVAAPRNVYIKIYKGALPSSTFLISGLTLLYETSQLWDANSDNTKSIIIPTNITVESDKYVYVLFSTLSSVNVVLKKWSNNTNADRTYLLFKASTDYANEFTGTWNMGSTTLYMQVDPILSLTPPFVNLSDISSYSPVPRITMPSKIYAVVGTELNLYYDALILGTDCGLKSPKEYSVEILCSKGIQKERCYQLLAQSGDVGNYQMTINVYNSNHAIIETKTITLYVISATAPSLDGEPIVMIGDSLMAAGVITSTVRDKFVALGSKIPLFKGFIGTTPNNHQGIGGWTFSNYATAGPNYYKFNVSGVTSISAGAVYSNNGSQFTIREANLIAGAGYIKGERTSGTNAPSASGALTKVSGSGDTSISFSSVVLEAGNPLWNPITSALDISYYRSNLGMGATKFKVVTIQLGINESFGAVKSEADRTAVITSAKAICAAFLADNSATKIIIMLPSTDGNTKGGWGANYGATGYKSEYQMNIWRLRELIISNFDNAAYSVNVEVGIAGLVIDRYYGYGRTTQAISGRISTTEEVHVNALHPVTEGHAQMGDATFAQILHLLQ